MKLTQSKIWLCLFLPISSTFSTAYAAPSSSYFDASKNRIQQLFAPQSATANQVNLQQFKQFPLDIQSLQERLPVVTSTAQNTGHSTTNAATVGYVAELGLQDAIQQALQRRPEITRSIATLAGQAANIDAAKAQYYPQISGGISTADLTTGERGRQLYSLSATQVLYDFGKIKSAVNIEQAKLLEEQANVLVSIDDIAYQTANAIVNINRYREIVKIAHQQIQGIARIAEIANLRAQAGISSQADPVQAQSNVEAAQSNLLVQESQLKQYQQTLRTLLGYDVLYEEPSFSQIPKMMAAQAAVQVAQYQSQETKRSVYPSIYVKGSLNQALNGKNPNNNEDDGMYSSVMLEANSNFFQGGALRAKQRSAAYAEQAAKAEVQSVYLDVLDQIRLIREQIDNKQKQMEVLALRKNTTARTKELYQEQYKLGTRTVVDLLNSEQAIHSAAQEIETARYDIYAGLIQYIHVTGRSRDLYQLNNTKIQGVEIQP